MLNIKEKYCSECGTKLVKKVSYSMGFNYKTGKPAKPFYYTDCPINDTHMRGKR